MATDVFVSYSRGDKAFVEKLDALLKAGGVATWLDVANLTPGMKWEDAIEREIPHARVFLTCLSATAVDHRGYFQVEQHLASKAAMRVPSDQVFIIPVLLGECELPRELHQYHSVNLAEPGAIESLLSSISGALERRIQPPPDSVAELRESLRRHLLARGIFGGSGFSDRHVNDVVVRLREMHERQGTEFLDPHELFAELDFLFERKTFRYEALRRCPEQRWVDRVDSGYQTLRVFEAYLRNVRIAAPAQYPIYRDIVMELDKYCMQMGALLLDPPLDYNDVEEHIGKSTFKARVGQSIQFPRGPDRQPQISDEINDMIDPHRLRAVELMDQLIQGLGRRGA